jgi:hypothetical protein
VPQERKARTGLQLRKVPLEPRACARQALGHALLEGKRRLGRNALRHETEAAGRKRKEQRRLDDVLVRQREHVLDAHGLVAGKARDQRLEKAVDVALVHGEQELLLAREVEVDRSLGETRLVGDVRHVGDAVGRAREEARRRVENGVVPLLLVFGLDGPLANDHISLS